MKTPEMFEYNYTHTETQPFWVTPIYLSLYHHFLLVYSTINSDDADLTIQSIHVGQEENVEVQNGITEMEVRK